MPFPHTIIDDVLPADLFRLATSEFPADDHPTWTGYLHFNEAKFANTSIETWGPTLRLIASELCTDSFAALLGDLTGFDRLIADPGMDGGGLHQTLPGGYLNVHTDFTTNHRVRHWQRRVNVLLYLNETWEPEWGGELQLWDAAVSRCVRSISPIGNRMVIFTTSDDAYHGHPEPLACPSGTTRRSLALYYFTTEVKPRRRATHYRSRPGDGWKRVGIWLDRCALGAYDVAKTRIKVSDRFASGVLKRASLALRQTRRAR